MAPVGWSLPLAKPDLRRKVGAFEHTEAGRQ